VQKWQVAANSFWDPPLPWVLFFGFWWCPTTRCQSPCCSSVFQKISLQPLL
jgi:hypothetical protein